MHPFCRCSDYPYIKGKKGTRSARDENGKTIFIPDDMTYSEWYKKYVEGGEKKEKLKKAVENSKKSDIIKNKITYRTTRTGKTIAARTIQGKYDVKLSDESYSHIVNPVFDKYEVFAGKGSDKELRVRDFLVDNYGGKPEAWFHAKGYTKVADESGTIRKANVHWFEEETVGIREMFVKGWSKK